MGQGGMTVEFDFRPHSKEPPMTTPSASPAGPQPVSWPLAPTGPCASCGTGRRRYGAAASPCSPRKAARQAAAQGR